MTRDDARTTADGAATQYLDDVARMLGDTDPAYRAEVLAGVHDHLAAALGPAPWPEARVRTELDRLGPPEEIASAALEDTGVTAQPPRRPRLAGAWVPPVVVTLLAVGVLATLYVLGSISGYVVPGTSGAAFSPGPLHFVGTLPLLLLLPPAPLVLVGALLVTVSPLYRTADRVAAWLVLPWCAAVLELGGLVVRAVDDCSAATGGCTGLGPGTVRAALLGALAVAVLGVVLLLVRLARVARMGARAAGGWWTATAAALGLLVSALPVVLLPLAYRENSYVSRSLGGLVARPGTLGDTLGPVLVVTPVWVVAVFLLVRSPLWGRPAKALALALVPALLGAMVVVAVTPPAYTPSVLRTVDTAVLIAAGVVVLVVAGVFARGQRAGASSGV